MNKKEFIEKARKVHGDRYDYSKVEYISSKIKICIICPTHGEFWQRADKHLIGQGCPSCSKTLKNDTSSFIEKARKVHGDRYDYSKVDYMNNKTKVCIICKEHGEFWQTPHNHLKGKGCSLCAKNLPHPTKSNTKEFIEKAKQVHGDRYDYSKVEYIDANTKVCIICKEHGEFWQTPYVHLHYNGCPICSHNELGLKRRKDAKVFLEQIKQVHGNKYDYSKINYINAKTKVELVCPKHGSFFSSPWHLMEGCGCSKCVHHISKAENEIYEYVCTLVGKENVIQSDRTILKGQELDIYIPSLEVAIEYNGLYWHNDKKHSEINYHLNKTNKCKEQGIKLLQIFEDEYRDKKEIVLNKIKHIIGVSESLPKIMGRKCEIKVINLNDARDFLNTYHIQGFAASTVYLGCYYQNELIGVMTFRKSNKNNEGYWELTRFATNYNYICQGIGGKLFSYFIKHYEYIEIKSFADRRWTVDETNNVYLQLGFDFQNYVKPDYHYVEQTTNPVRKHKFLFRKERVNKKYGLPLTMTESEMTKELNLQKIYDCGLIKYLYNNAK